MSPDLSIIVADVSRLAAIREGTRLPGRVMHFTSGNLASAMDTIRAHKPRVVAIDALFAETPSGAAFADRVNALSLTGLAILLIIQHDGRWTTAPRGSASAVALAEAPGQYSVPNTRRAPRFRIEGSIEATVEAGRANLVDMSVLGAQIVSLPALRPRQKIKIGLPDTDDVLNVIAQVAWSTFERPELTAEPHYRAGVEFAGAAQQLLEDYRRRHCGDRLLSAAPR